MLGANKHTAQHLDGAPHDVVSVGQGDNAKGDVTLRINPHPAYIRYDSKYTHAAHEVGHMLGIADEYEDHVEVGLVEGQEEPMAASGADSVVRNADTASLMSAGGEVLPAHLTTAWEALTRMTSAYLDRSDWQFE